MSMKSSNYFLIAVFIAKVISAGSDFATVSAEIPSTSEMNTGTCQAGSSKTKCDSSYSQVINGNYSGHDNHRRYVVDGMLSTFECEMMEALQQVAGRIGDGYVLSVTRGKYGSPHSENESLSGFSPLRLAQLVKNGTVKPQHAIYFFKAANYVINKAKELFKLSELYFHFVHLACREAVNANGTPSSVPQDRPSESLSHGIHADNCDYNSANGDCKIYNYNPGLINRNFSSLLYLNRDFVGGDFFFVNRPGKQVAESVSPKCGRLVTFHSSELHGVRAVQMGKRCALTTWFTLNKSEEYQDFGVALKDIYDFLIINKEITWKEQ